MSNPENENETRPGLQHVISPHYVYLMPSGFIFSQDTTNDRVSLVFYHDELRVVAETFDSQSKITDYVAQPIRVQDVQVTIKTEDFVRNLRQILEGLSENSPEILAKNAIKLEKIG